VLLPLLKEGLGENLMAIQRPKGPRRADMHLEKKKKSLRESSDAREDNPKMLCLKQHIRARQRLYSERKADRSLGGKNIRLQEEDQKGGLHIRRGGGKNQGKWEIPVSAGGIKRTRAYL